MEPVRIVTGTAVPLRRSDVDTDQIIPSDWLKRVERTGFGAGLFAEWRDDRDFVLNDADHAGATILVAGPNFGTGSSREHAVWALMDYGFQAVISPRFGDIFRNNCTKAGLVPAQVDPDTGRRLLDALEADPHLEVQVDVERGTVAAPAAGIEGSFPLDDFTRHRLLEGLDDVGLTLTHAADIDGFERDRPTWLPRAGLIVIGRALATLGWLAAGAVAVWVLPRLVAERRFRARLARPVPPWPPVPGDDGAGAGAGAAT